MPDYQSVILQYVNERLSPVQISSIYMYLPNFFLIIFNICYKSLTINKLQQVFLGMFVYIYNVSDRGYQGKGLPCILCLVYA